MLYQKEVKNGRTKVNRYQGLFHLNQTERLVIHLFHVLGLFKILFPNMIMKNEMTTGDSSTSLFCDFSDTAFMSRLFQC